MAFEHKPGQFSLFKNSYKQDGDNKPDYKGKGKDLAGADIEVAAWLRDGKEGGARWLSCKIAPARTPAEQAEREAQPEPAPKQEQDRGSSHFSNMKDDIPF